MRRLTQAWRRGGRDEDALPGGGSGVRDRDGEGGCWHMLRLLAIGIAMGVAVVYMVMGPQSCPAPAAQLLMQTPANTSAAVGKPVTPTDLVASAPLSAATGAAIALNAAATNWPTKILEHGRNVYTQSGIEGMLEFIFKNIGTENKFFVEFGFDTGSWDGGIGSNTKNLHFHHGWKGLLMDGGFENKEINLHKHFITADNIVELFTLHEVPVQVDYVSVDLDSLDLWVFREIAMSRFRPRVISAEFNVHTIRTSTLTLGRDDRLGWQFDRVYGAAAGAFMAVASETGYRLVARASSDIIFVREDLLRGFELPDTNEILREASCWCFHTFRNQSRAARFWDYDVWRLTKGDAAKAQAAAALEVKRSELACGSNCLLG